MNLNYKASNIAKAERKHGVNFFNLMGNIGNNLSMSSLQFLYDAGGATEEEFDAAFSKGVDSMLKDILEGLKNAGFLKQEDLDKVLSEMEKAQKASQNIGETAKK